MKYAIIAMLWLASLALAYFCGRRHAPAPTPEIIERVRVDTIRIAYPEVMVVRPRPPVQAVLAVADTATGHDSVAVEVPMVQKVYSGDDYRAYVSGYRPQLDSLIMHRRIETHTALPATGQSRWSIGVQAGYGITPRGLQPYIGIGVAFRIL